MAQGQELQGWGQPGLGTGWHRGHQAQGGAVVTRGARARHGSAGSRAMGETEGGMWWQPPCLPVLAAGGCCEAPTPLAPKPLLGARLHGLGGRGLSRVGGAGGSDPSAGRGWEPRQGPQSHAREQDRPSRRCQWRGDGPGENRRVLGATMAPPMLEGLPGVGVLGGVPPVLPQPFSLSSLAAVCPPRQPRRSGSPSAVERMRP